MKRPLHKVQLLVFDLDGTLIDSRDDIVSSVNLALGSMGLAPFPEAQIAGEIGRGSEYLFRSLLGQNTPRDQIQELGRKFRQIYAENLVQQTKVYPGILEALHHYSDLPKVIVTNKNQVFAERLVDALELRAHFEAVFGLEAFPTQKPDPGPLLEVCKRWQRHPSQAAMIGDSVFDIAAGKEAGLVTVGALYGLGSPKELRQHNPDFEITRAGELVELF